MSPLISIIVPVYNVESYLERCVNSLLNQTYTNIEIILIDDGSTDNSPLLCDQFKSIDERVVVHHKKNEGLSSARNKGIEMATGMYIGFVDSDDFVAEDMFEKLLDASMMNSAEISLCARYHYYDNGNTSSADTLPSAAIWSNEQAISNLLVWNKIDSSACNKLFKTSLFESKRFPIGKRCEDVFIIPELICASSKVVHIGEPKYYYYQRHLSITHAAFSMNFMDILEAHESVANFVIKQFPDLKSKAKSFYYNAFLSVYLTYYSAKATSVYATIKTKIDSIAKAGFFSILFDQYITSRNKFLFTVIFLKFHGIYHKMRSAIYH
jgi:glycosyltransferase involved in cell wall biosynthesis